MWTIASMVQNKLHYSCKWYNKINLFYCHSEALYILLVWYLLPPQSIFLCSRVSFFHLPQSLQLLLFVLSIIFILVLLISHLIFLHISQAQGQFLDMVIYAAAWGHHCSLGPSTAGYISNVVSNIFSMHSYNALSGISSGLHTGRSPRFIFLLGPSMS